MLSHPLRRFEAHAGGRHREGQEVAGSGKKAITRVNRRSHRSAATSFDNWARETLAADTELAVQYLREVLERADEPEEPLLGLRRIAEAQGMSRVAEAAGLSRESLYRSLSAAGNPNDQK
jgi:probable addiction module antidote protein